MTGLVKGEEGGQILFLARVSKNDDVQETRSDPGAPIFIDFECLKTKPPHPALLGVLIGSEGEDLQQLITDPELAPARVAKRKRTHAVDLNEAIRELLAMAAAEHRPIVGWSYFDRDRLIEACPDLKSEITARYVNALHIARPWRKHLYPTFKIEREDEHSARHTLDQYAALAGYPHASAFKDAKPARWIRHVREQLRATGGNYGRTTSETKRDWHKLLDYNRHDLLALRHIVLRAARELECWRAYERTRFCVDEGPRRICFMAGSRSPRLQALLRRHGVATWAFVTAWNPASVPQRPEQNAQRQLELMELVAAKGYGMLPGEGIGEDPKWTPEESVLILGIGRREAIRLGRRFGQLAIVVGKLEGPASLVSCAAPPRIR